MCILTIIWNNGKARYEHPSTKQGINPLHIPSTPDRIKNNRRVRNMINLCKACRDADVTLLDLIAQHRDTSVKSLPEYDCWARHQQLSGRW